MSSAGLLTAFHIGAAAELKKLGILNSSTALAGLNFLINLTVKIYLGSSGGALAAATSGLNIDSTKALNACCYIAQRCRVEGTRLTLRRALDDVLNELLPNDSHEILKTRGTPCIIAFTEIYPSIRPHFVDEFQSKEDLIDCLRASCNIPFYFNGNSPFVTVRGVNAVDGFFTVDLPRFGCPPTGASEREIIICPYPASRIGLSPQFSLDNNILDLRDDQKRVNSRSSDISIEKKESNCKFDLITPDLLLQDGGKDQWPFSILEVLKMSLGPPIPSSDKDIQNTYNFLFQAGKQAVTIWNNKQLKTLK